MKFATFPDGSPDGRLYIVSRDLRHKTPAKKIGSLQQALEAWAEVAPALEQEYASLNDFPEKAEVSAFNTAEALAPLPRAWQWLDGSAYSSHGDLMDKVFGMEKKEKSNRPLMYQGLSDRFLAPMSSMRAPSEADGIDFEGEFGIITDTVPMGVPAANALAHIRLIVQINDWSLRKIAPIEMKTGFGWVQAKPACAMAPVAVTPDELGEAWRDGRVDLPLVVDYNGKRFGAANGYHMDFGFHELVAHAAYSRDLVPGTVIGSGTVSNSNYREVGSSCIAERRGIEIVDTGEAKTEYMRFGERVRMEAVLADGTPLFGAIDQVVVQA
ncbi:fumarylacetoacetate hydrolase family protein [Rhizobium rhizogenes]|uniref:fumarylacetoacetate hydrolase family protein n=1 Tax=Rhizobium rhizogenes TaxID=359 RepID=UPI00157352E5|nr:fumarylacetoacetate hydrolase family protein [Rhizobium rhizogenes]NTI78520.1 fumarylacetoacetate hydrolase [Rhizobium rhizogenes]